MHQIIVFFVWLFVDWIFREEFNFWFCIVQNELYNELDIAREKQIKNWTTPEL